MTTWWKAAIAWAVLGLAIGIIGTRGCDSGHIDRQAAEIARLESAQVITGVDIPDWLNLRRLWSMAQHDTVPSQSVEYRTDPALTRQVADWRKRAEAAEWKLRASPLLAGVVTDSATAVELVESWAVNEAHYRHGTLTWLASRPPAVCGGMADGLGRVWTLTASAQGVNAAPRWLLFGCEWALAGGIGMVTLPDTFAPCFNAFGQLEAERGWLTYSAGPMFDGTLKIRADVVARWRF